MIIKFSCACGNTSPSRAKEYDGSLGYEAIVCLDCGRYSDHSGEHEADKWSLDFCDVKKSLANRVIENRRCGQWPLVTIS